MILESPSAPFLKWFLDKADEMRCLQALVRRQLLQISLISCLRTLKRRLKKLLRCLWVQKLQMMICWILILCVNRWEHELNNKSWITVKYWCDVLFYDFADDKKIINCFQPSDVNYKSYRIKITRFDPVKS